MRDIINKIYCLSERKIHMETFNLLLAIGLGLAAIISPMAVARINNRHDEKMRLKEFAHVETLKKMEYEHSLSEKRFSFSFQNKMDAFSDLVDAYILYLDSDKDETLFTKLSLAAAKASMYCSLDDARSNVLSALYASHSECDCEHVNQLIARIDSLICALQLELSSEIHTKQQPSS